MNTFEQGTKLATAIFRSRRGDALKSLTGVFFFEDHLIVFGSNDSKYLKQLQAVRD